MTKAQQLSIVLIIAAGQAVTKYKIIKAMTEMSTQAPPPERDQKLEDFFGEGLWNVALKPVYRSVCMDADDSRRTRFIPVNG